MKKKIKNKWGKWKPISESKIKKYLKKLKVEGKECYDKYISNYAEYSWNELPIPRDSKKSFKRLGWDKQSWDRKMTTVYVLI